MTLAVDFGSHLTQAGFSLGFALLSLAEEIKTPRWQGQKKEGGSHEITQNSVRRVFFFKNYLPPLLECRIIWKSDQAD